MLFSNGTSATRSPYVNGSPPYATLPRMPPLLYRHTSARHSSRKIVAKRVPSEHCATRASLDDNGVNPSLAACSWRLSVC